MPSIRIDDAWFDSDETRLLDDAAFRAEIDRMVHARIKPSSTPEATRERKRRQRERQRGVTSRDIVGVTSRDGGVTSRDGCDIRDRGVTSRDIPENPDKHRENGAEGVTSRDTRLYEVVKSSSSLGNKSVNGDDDLSVPCSYETEFGDDEIAIMVARWQEINTHLDERWFRRSLRLAHRSCGPMDKQTVGRTMKAVREQLKNKLAIADSSQRGFVSDPDRYVSTVFTAKLKEATDGRRAAAR